MINTMKHLGKHPKKTDHRTLMFARYMLKLPAPYLVVDHASKLGTSIGMMGNDKYGDCTVAAAGHQIQSWTAYSGDGILTLSDAAILAAYKVLSANDDGAYMLDVLNYWRKTGIGGDKIEAFVETGTGDLTQAKLAIEYFGSLYIGMSLPDTNTFGPWNVLEPTWKPNPNNGHCVALVGYDDTKKMFKVCTWGEVWDMSYAWYQKYVDESYAVLNDIELSKASGKSPEGFDWTALQDDLNHIGDPVVVPPAPPTPPPTPPVTGPTSPLVITAFGSVKWSVWLDGASQGAAHVDQLEAIQHADQLRWKNPKSHIEIQHTAVYKVK